MTMLYFISVWLHILAAAIWLGGMAFLALVLVPWLRRGDRELAGNVLRDTGLRFRNVGWTCFAVLSITGTFNLWVRGTRFGDFVRVEWLTSPFGSSVVLKLATFFFVLIISVMHDFVLGPRAAAAIVRAPDAPEATRLRRDAALLGRFNALLGLLLLAVAVTLVRGCPG